MHCKSLWIKASDKCISVMLRCLHSLVAHQAILSGFILGVLIYLDTFVLNWNILASFSFPATVNAGLLIGELKHYVTV